ncbi:N-acetylmuramoyl-L-alanine amidase [Bacillus thermotolerans]|uniref:N-acetylmuramoyl-L-alanine amidase n=1 Tax=Bacillus thermotolerans TaxID=1221996 RepID=A0A0F5HTE1_BACTR|nr:N-acetylmuramoyl-L-alanine amidase [Bacillus thermotolerans]KKB36556.1 N-acetylmuramoyl-L-alanine amidase [Bacillus thermotolerans]KKB40976.1 N-acetylmuramoyl-L-alanine amidase [Bacillus thermotolerans]KKB44957.1 N-acetylmuramoyl-L-alanine amidase [Bacillus thermotolerans]
MNKRLFLTLLSLSLVISLFGIKHTAQAAGSFSDVGASHRAMEEIYYLATGGIAQGSASNEFQPGKIMTRAEAATFIGRALGLDGTKRSTGFTDVGSEMFASGYIQSAAEKGILSGYKGGDFRPYQTVTRGEMAVMISKAFGYKHDGKLSVAAASLKSRGIAQGKTDGSFGADESIIRADFAVFLARAINPQLRLKDNTVEFNKTYWINAGDFLNVRTGPSHEYEKVGSVLKDEQVLSAFEIGGWHYIKHGSLEGFVNGYYLRDTAEAKPAVDSRLENQVIVIDPGHGGSDPGATGYGLREKDVVLDTSLRLNELFKQTPFKSRMTRSTDIFITLNGRVSYAKSAGADAFISIHANAAGGTGTETYYYNSAYRNPNSADSRLLATKIQNRLVHAWGLRDRGVKHGNFHVIRENTMPAVLVELGFIDRKTDSEKLGSSYWRNAAAKAIYLGTLDYYKAKGYDVDSLYDVAK